MCLWLFPFVFLLGLLGLVWGADNQRPTIQITSPTSNATTTAQTSPLLVGGTASDRKSGVAQVLWQTDRGASGLATGTTTWQASIPLAVGLTRLTVTAIDAENNRASDTLTITFAGMVPLPVSHVLAWDYAAVAAGFGVHQCASAALPCTPGDHVATVDGTLRTVELGNLDGRVRYCWFIRLLPTGQLSNTVCSP